jgi:hypothetical protein
LFQPYTSKKDRMSKGPVPPIDLKRITTYKLALIFESANHWKFVGLFGSEAARLLTSNEATLETCV